MNTATDSSAPKYSILITSFRSLRYLEECLGSLVALRGPSFEVLFLENGSPDPEADWVENNVRDPRFRVFRLAETRYFAGGVNFIAPHARGEFLVLLNSDAKVEPDWLEKLDAYLERTGYEVAGSNVVEPNTPGHSAEQRWCLDPFGTTQMLPPRTDGGPIFTAGGCGMAIRRSVWEEAGGLDGDFKMYFEEVDLNWRLDLMGYRVGWCREATLYHVGQGSARPSFFIWNRFRGRRNRVWAYVKNAGPVLLTVFLLTHPFVMWASILGNLLRGRPRFAVAETAAFAAAFWNIGIPLSKRGAIQRARRISDAEMVRREFIVLRVKGLSDLLDRLKGRKKRA